MTHKDDSLTITLMIKTLSFEKEVTGEFSITWARHGKNGSTSKKKINSNNKIVYDVYFPMECNFKRKKHVWSEKVVSLFLYQGKKRMHKWSVNLAELYSRDIIHEELKWEIASIGNVTLSIAYFKGFPEKPATVPRVIESNEILKHKRYSITLLPQFHSDLSFQNLITETRRTSLNTTRRPNQITFQSIETYSPHQNLNVRRSKNSMISLSNSKFLFTSPQEKNAMTIGIDELTDEMREEGPKYINGVPYFGIKTYELFIGQPVGTNIISPLEKVCNSVCNIAQLSLELLLYGFMSLSCLFVGLKNKKINFDSIESDVKDRIEYLFTDLVQKLGRNYKNDLLSDDIQGLNKKLENFFTGIEGDNFGVFLVGLIEYALFGSLPPKIAKQRITNSNIDQLPFFDKSLLKVSEKERQLVPPEKLYQATLNEITSAPVPSIIDC